MDSWEVAAIKADSRKGGGMTHEGVDSCAG